MVTTVVHGATVKLAASADGGAPTVEEIHGKPTLAPELASAKTFLLARPLGVYTCGRAVPTRDIDADANHVNHFRLVLWPFHLARLARGRKGELKERLLDKAIVEVLQTTTTVLVTRALREAGDGTTDHAMVTALWSVNVDGMAVRIDVHVCPMPQVKAPTANVLVDGYARHEPECKHTRWITDRIPLERHQQDVATLLQEELHESILSSVAVDGGDRVLLEGLITNFFVVKDGSIYTAAVDVLAGSTREMVLRACEALDIPVVLEAPRLSEIATWDAAFLTSAVRIMVPIANVIWFPLDDPKATPQRHALDTVLSEERILQPLRSKICDLWQTC